MRGACLGCITQDIPRCREHSLASPSIAAREYFGLSGWSLETGWFWSCTETGPRFVVLYMRAGKAMNLLHRFHLCRWAAPCCCGKPALTCTGSHSRAGIWVWRWLVAMNIYAISFDVCPGRLWLSFTNCTRINSRLLGPWNFVLWFPDERLTHGTVRVLKSKLVCFRFHDVTATSLWNPQVIEIENDNDLRNLIPHFVAGTHVNKSAIWKHMSPIAESLVTDLLKVRIVCFRACTKLP